MGDGAMLDRLAAEGPNPDHAENLLLLGRSGPFRWECHILQGGEVCRLADKMRSERVSGGN
jgi:hypothetical protein